MNPAHAREFRINHLCGQLGFTRDDPTLNQLWQLVEEQRALLESMGPFDPAFEYITKQRIALENLAFARECQDRDVTFEMENKLKKLLPILGHELFNHTSTSAFQKAVEYEERWHDESLYAGMSVGQRNLKRNTVKQTSEAYLVLSELVPAVAGGWKP